MELKDMQTALAKIEASVTKTVEDVAGFTKRAQEDIARCGTITTETNEKLKEVVTKGANLATEAGELKSRVLAVEQMLAKRGVGSLEEANHTAGDVFTGSDEYKQAVKTGQKSTGTVRIGSFHKTAVINATGQNQPLVPSDRLSGIVTPATRRLTVRDLLPAIRSQSNLIEFAKENVFTNAAAPQFSAGNYENVAKAEAAITFLLEKEPVQTIAHWIPASRQILEDAPLLAGYINNRLIYGLKLVEEDNLLNGSGSSGELHGLVTQATAFSETLVTGDTQLDILLKAMLQAARSEYAATGIVLHPADWTAMMLLKDSQGRYIFSDPHSAEAPRVWGLPVVPTNSQTEGDFLVGGFAQAATIVDRDDATVRVAEQHADFFIKNMVAILAEERAALVVFRPAALIKGSF